MTCPSTTIASFGRGPLPASRRSICLAKRIPDRVIARRAAVLNGYRPPSDARVHYDPGMREWPTTTEVAPSILSADFARMRDHTAEVLEAGARVIHIDVMDGHIDQFAAAGADSITVHVETCPHIHYTLDRIKQLGCRAGVTLNPGTPVEAVWEASRYADVLLCMSVNPGWGGQRFIPATLDRMPRLRDYARGRGDDGVAVEVDGGVNRGTIRDVFDAGANILVAGSAIFGSPSSG